MVVRQLIEGEKPPVQPPNSNTVPPTPPPEPVYVTPATIPSALLHDKDFFQYAHVFDKTLLTTIASAKYLVIIKDTSRSTDVAPTGVFLLRCAETIRSVFDQENSYLKVFKCLDVRQNSLVVSYTTMVTKKELDFLKTRPDDVNLVDFIEREALKRFEVPKSKSKGKRKCFPPPSLR